MKYDRARSGILHHVIVYALAAVVRDVFAHLVVPAVCIGYPNVTLRSLFIRHLDFLSGRSILFPRLRPSCTSCTIWMKGGTAYTHCRCDSTGFHLIHSQRERQAGSVAHRFCPACVWLCVKWSLSHLLSKELVSKPRLTKSSACLQKEDPHGQPCKCAHPARFSPDDKFSRERVTLKKRFGILPTQMPPPEH